MVHDLRYAFRVLSTNLTFSIVAICALALGIGANTGIFAVVNGELLSRAAVSVPSFEDYQQQNRVFSHIAAFATLPRTNSITFDWRVFLFTAVISALTGVLFGNRTGVSGLANLR